ncbi:hypothetical protein FG386_002293 [Cryptosporidium ryanae]|uniref:uncharacterized protein n=1 Tax=Cryptosporidium ryanae TaxID=515981 RepID=UPI00351A09EB|nr:hypothetical protein FG386_002293 [Cryptosporidium ryanae]
MGINYFHNKKRSWIWGCVLFGEDNYVMDPGEDEMFRYLRIEDQLSSVYDKMGITEYYDEIMRDVSRTFPKLGDFQKKENQTKMLRILFKISYALPEVGYCQGMNYLVGILLYAFNFNVEQVYSSIMSILIKWEYKDIYNKELTKLREMCFVFNELIKEYLPHVYNQIFYNKYEVNAENKITSELFAIQWFLTLFIYDIADTDYAINSVYILDNIIIHNTNRNLNVNVYKIAISLLSKIFKDFDLGSDVEIIHILEFIRRRSKYILTTPLEIEKLLKESRDLLLSEALLQKIQIKYKRLNIDVINEDNNHSTSVVNGENGKAKDMVSKLLRKYKLFNQNNNKNGIYINDNDGVPSPFHPYFSI